MTLIKSPRSDYVYDSSNDVIDFNKWASGEPSGDESENNCVRVQNGLWYSITCKGNKAYYVCEIPPQEYQEFWDAAPINYKEMSINFNVYSKLIQSKSEETQQSRKYLSIGGSLSGVDMNVIYLADILSESNCTLNMTLPETLSNPIWYIENDNLVVCESDWSVVPTSVSDTNCFMYSDVFGWESVESEDILIPWTNTARTNYCLIKISPTKTAIIGGASVRPLIELHIFHEAFIFYIFRIQLMFTIAQLELKKPK